MGIRGVNRDGYIVVIVVVVEEEDEKGVGGVWWGVGLEV